jgi:hypothetical protein
MTDTPDDEYPTRPRRLGEGLFHEWTRGLPRYSQDPTGFVAGFKQRAMAAQARGNFLHGGIFTPEPEPERLSPAARRQERWAEVIGSADRAAWRLHHFDGEWVAQAESWLLAKAKARKDKRLVLAGPSSTGKTSAASAIAHEWWQGGRRPVIFVLVSDLLTAQLDPALAPVFSRLATADEDTLVILDDLTSSATWGNFANLVNRLDALGARILTTTNLTASERRDPHVLDPRVRSRLEPEDVLAVPMPRVLNGAPPEVPGTGPCPYHCEPPGTFALGDLARCDIPEVAALTEQVIETEMVHPGDAPYYGLHRPDLNDYAELDPDEAQRFYREAWARWDRAFDWHSRETGHWCPHCRPEMCRRDDFLERQLAGLGRPIA